MEINHINNGVTYEDWKKNYLKPTFQNIFRYLIKDGYFILNINNFENYKLIEDSISIAENIGFVFIEQYKLKNIKRCKSTGGFNDNSEPIFVFTKNAKE